MTLSRTARILIALLLVAAAAFVWINFFAETPDTPPIGAPTVEAPATPADGDAAVGDGVDGVTAGDGDATVDVTADATDPIDATGAPSADATDGAGAPAAPGTEAGPPTVVAPADVDVVGRDVVVAELPFLITEPPAIATEGDADAEAEAAGAGAARPGFGTRASVNPFSPIVVQEPAQAAAPPDQPASPEVVDVEVPSAPEVETVEAAPPAPRAPAPSALAPASPRTASLPRALPGGTLPVAPDVLTSSRSEPRQIAPPDLSARAAIREPATPSEAPTLRPIGGTLADGSTQPTPLAPGEVAAAGIPDRPLVSGADTLSQYLRDRNVAFTGSVVGSVGVGVFRVNGKSSPIVLALGQPLPDTDIVLTDLRGQAAQFTLGDTTHVLNLDLRR